MGLFKKSDVEFYLLDIKFECQQLRRKNEKLLSDLLELWIDEAKDKKAKRKAKK
jgi:hypothetical protein